MRLPRFWRDTGGWNDTLVTLCLLAASAVSVLLALRMRSPWPAVIGPPIGFCLGIALVFLLSRFFSRDDSQES